MENKIAWEKYPEGNKQEEVFQFAENYRKFISDCKTCLLYTSPSPRDA